jgi:hypothetical protein
VASEFYPAFPQQQSDVSYGRDQANPAVLGYFIVPTPGAPNADSGPGFAPEVQFSRRSGTFLSPFQLTLTTADPPAVIRYTTNDMAVATNSPITRAPSRSAAAPHSRAVSRRGCSPALCTARTISCWRRVSLISVLTCRLSSCTPWQRRYQRGAGAPDTPATVTIIEPDLSRPHHADKSSFRHHARRHQSPRPVPGLNKRNPQWCWDEANRDFEIETLGMPAESDWVLYPPNGFDHP